MNKSKGKHAENRHVKRKKIKEYNNEKDSKKTTNRIVNEMHTSSMSGIDMVDIVKETDTSDELVKLERSYTKEELEEMIEVIKSDIQEERDKSRKTKKQGKLHKKRIKNEKEKIINEKLKEKQYIKEHKIEKTKNKNPIKKFALGIVELILLAIIAFSGYKITIWIKDNNENNTIKEELESVVIETTNEEEKEIKNNLLNAQNYTINFYKLQQNNKDVVGWVKVNNLEIEYPVVKTIDNEFYLDHNLNKNLNGAGWIFADYRNKFDGTDKNIVLYGHNRKDGSMFGTLKYAQKEDWYKNEDNKNVVFITPDGKYNYEVFSAYTIETEDYYIKTSFKTGEFDQFIKRLKSRSVYDFGVEVGEDDQILTFSTCAGENYRTVLHARKVREE